MQTLGYRFKPWTDEKALADGPSILEYVRETAREAGIDQYVRFGHQVRGAAWADGRWTLDIDGREPLSCTFLYVCGDYRYDQGYLPSFDDAESFAGEIIHPQFWPEDLDYTGKRVVVIGSGATAVTIVPAMTDKAAHVTMLQRSPTYILSLPSEGEAGQRAAPVAGEPARLPGDALEERRRLDARLPALPSASRSSCAGSSARACSPRSRPAIPVDTHFNPTYGPWDQRLCLVPDGDLFRALSRDKASIVTDRVERFTPHRCPARLRRPTSTPT